MGLRVPPGFVVTSSTFTRFMELTGLAERLPKFIGALDYEDSQRLHYVSSRIQQIICATPWPQELSADIELAVVNQSTVMSKRYAVRSSAIGEDGEATSFAGQHSTFLNVAPNDVVNKVRACYASLYESRALAYRLKNGLDISTAVMAVVVQEMLNPLCSGVMFTQDYNTGEDRVVIEAVYGVGEALVSGQITPDPL